MTYMTHVRARAVTTTYNYGANIKSIVRDRETPTCIVVEYLSPDTCTSERLCENGY